MHNEALPALATFASCFSVLAFCQLGCDGRTQHCFVEHTGLFLFWDWMLWFWIGFVWVSFVFCDIQGVGIDGWSHSCWCKAGCMRINVLQSSCTLGLPRHSNCGRGPFLQNCILSVEMLRVACSDILALYGQFGTSFCLLFCSVLIVDCAELLRCAYAIRSARWLAWCKACWMGVTYQTLQLDSGPLLQYRLQSGFVPAMLQNVSRGGMGRARGVWLADVFSAKLWECLCFLDVV